ncbi:hypothetical protein [Xanthomonas arboricola]|uniref:hypothetical protein n=1 Tax=Xanthomonas arboricola TaxID=56448 RepID=UPI0011B0700D|nr:hypothetical protein [Xanthomonas arboricola]
MPHHRHPAAQTSARGRFAHKPANATALCMRPCCALHRGHTPALYVRRALACRVELHLHAGMRAAVFVVDDHAADLGMLHVGAERDCRRLDHAVPQAAWRAQQGAARDLHLRPHIVQQFARDLAQEARGQDVRRAGQGSSRQ